MLDEYALRAPDAVLLVPLPVAGGRTVQRTRRAITRTAQRQFKLMSDRSWLNMSASFSTHRTRQHDRVRASRLTTRPCA